MPIKLLTVAKLSETFSKYILSFTIFATLNESILSPQRASINEKDKKSRLNPFDYQSSEITGMQS